MRSELLQLFFVIGTPEGARQLDPPFGGWLETSIGEITEIGKDRRIEMDGSTLFEF